MNSPETLAMEQRIYSLISRVRGCEAERINKLMDYTLEKCSFEERTLTLSFAVEWWMLNPFDTMHGGLICTAFDIAFGTLTVVLSDMKMCPTAQLDVSFLRPLTEGDRMLVQVKSCHMGKTIGNLLGECYSQRTGELCATATAVFFTGGVGKSYKNEL